MQSNFTSVYKNNCSLLPLKLVLVLFACLNFSVHSFSQQPAFPGAEGYGMYTTGGRGGVVYYVTDTSDNATNPAVGTFRYGVEKMSGTRTILFKVSGTISLRAQVIIRNGNITIAGQTAPGDGICLRNYTLRLNSSNIMVRYIRSRMGDITSYVDDAMDANGSAPIVSIHDIIVDHCSMSWSIDETGSFYDNKNFTLQWSILSESLYHSIDPKGDHGYAGIWGGQGASFHHNLLIHQTSRNPRFCGARYTGDTINEIVDMRNNVLYNWGNINSSYGGEGGNYNIVNNYYKAGPATPGSLTVSSTSNKRNRILNYTGYYYSTDSYYYPDTLFGGKFYVNGNYVDGFPDVTADNWTKGVQPDGYSRDAILMARNRLTAPIPFGNIRTQAATDAYLSVMDSVGAILPKRDTIDRRLIREARTGTATFEGAGYKAINTTGITHPSGIIDSQNDVNGWPVLNSAPAPVDTDNDGMPDVWETSQGSNPNDATDRNTVAANGYTALENYLNSITSSTLPLNLLSFKAISAGKTVQTSWATSNEINTKNFAVERSNDGSHFTSIGTVTAKNTTLNNSYTFADVLPLKGITYYRLKMIDKDGAFTYSAVVKLNTAIKGFLSINPNPVTDKLLIYHPIDALATIKIITIDGKNITSVKVAANASQTSINMSSFPAGLYYAVYETLTEKTSCQFEKK